MSTQSPKLWEFGFWLLEGQCLWKSVSKILYFSKLNYLLKAIQPLGPQSPDGPMFPDAPTTPPLANWACLLITAASAAAWADNAYD